MRVFSSLLQMCSRTSPAQAKLLLLAGLVPNAFPLIRMISVSAGPGLKSVVLEWLSPDDEMHSREFFKKGRRERDLSLQDVQLIAPSSPRDLSPCIAAAFLRSLWCSLMLSRGTEV